MAQLCLEALRWTRQRCDWRAILSSTVLRVEREVGAVQEECGRDSRRLLLVCGCERQEVTAAAAARVVACCLPSAAR